MHRKQPQRTTLAVAVFVGLASMASLPAMSQDSGRQEATTLDKLVVTAQKRQESLQDVPAAVSAFSDAQLRELARETEIDFVELVAAVDDVLEHATTATVADVLAAHPATQGVASVVGQGMTLL